MNSFQQFDGFLANRNKIIEDLQLKTFKKKILPKMKEMYEKKFN
jgi:c-di-GMP-related signal transduction protein